jgi:hypothetical protein
MVVEEQIFETAAASNEALEKGVAGKAHDATNGHGDAGGEEFGELGDLETVDMTGGALLQHMPETHVHAQGDDDGALDPMAMNPDLLPDSSHLSASATPDKAREIEAISERILVLNEHLQKSNVIFLPAPLPAAPCLTCPCRAATSADGGDFYIRFQILVCPLADVLRTRCFAADE